MAKETHVVEIYRDTESQWRWRFIARNGAVLADSGQGYSSRSKALHGVRIVCGFYEHEVRYIAQTREIYGYIVRDHGEHDFQVVSR